MSKSLKSEIKRKRKILEELEESSVDVKRVKVEFDEKTIEQSSKVEEHKKVKKKRKKKKKKKHKTKEKEEFVNVQPQTVQKENLPDISDHGFESHHLKRRNNFLESFKTDISQLELELNEEDQFEDLHKDITRLQLANSSRKCGRWNTQEMERLSKNVEQFRKINGIDNLKQWIESRNKAQLTRFYKFVAKNINRSEFAIYRCMKRLTNEENYIGKWSQDMNDELLRLHENYGNQWTIISQHLGISADLCRDHFRMMLRQSHSKGCWSSEEEQCLKEVLMKHGIDCISGDGSMPAGVTWDVIAQEVKTRNARQCRAKWTMMLMWKEQGGQELWDCMDDLKLLETLGSDYTVEDEDEVDWEGLIEEWESARTKYFIRQKWGTLKRRVPNHQFKTYQECLDYLLTHYLPVLREKCEEK